MIYYDSHNQPHEFPPDGKVEWRISAYAAVQNSKGELLLVVPTWREDYDMPGGGIEPAESLAAGVVRECYEETGYKVRLADDQPFYISETDFYFLKFNSFRHSVNFFYKAELISEDQHMDAINVAEPNEIAQVKWVPLDEITKDNCHYMYLPAIAILKKAR